MGAWSALAALLVLAGADDPAPQPDVATSAATAEPRFHVRAACAGCRSADPDFPFFDERHGMYHLMFQFFPVRHPDPVIGHAVSPDLVRWARLPVAVSNDSWYDRTAIWTGSATVVQGTPWLTYPGRCSPGVAGCGQTGFDYAQAVPADLTDPLYRVWRKLADNPILNDTFDDPSTAWKTRYGEYRFIGNSRINRTSPGQSPIFASEGLDFGGPWRRVGLANLSWGECPSLYPLPELYPGTAADNGTLPTHVHKRSRQTHNCSGDCSGDVVSLGSWLDGAPDEVGSWRATPGVPSDPVVIDSGNRYASKDFLDTKSRPSRRINWGWIHVPGGGQSIPRVQTYDPRLKRLIHSPLPEISKLHLGAPLAKLGRTAVPAGRSLCLGSPPEWLTGRGNSSDVSVTFELPERAKGRFGVRVMQTAGGSRTGAATGVLAFVDYVPPPAGFSSVHTVRVGLDPPCFACASSTDTLSLLPGEKSVTLRLFSDRSVVEAYWVDGRVAITSGGAKDDGRFGQRLGEEIGAVSIESEVDVVISAAVVHEMDSIWLEESQVLAMTL